MNSTWICTPHTSITQFTIIGPKSMMEISTFAILNFIDFDCLNKSALYSIHLICFVHIFFRCCRMRTKHRATVSISWKCISKSHIYQIFFGLDWILPLLYHHFRTKRFTVNLLAQQQQQKREAFKTVWFLFFCIDFFFLLLFIFGISKTNNNKSNRLRAIIMWTNISFHLFFSSTWNRIDYTYFDADLAIAYNEMAVIVRAELNAPIQMIRYHKDFK